MNDDREHDGGDELDHDAGLARVSPDSELEGMCLKRPDILFMIEPVGNLFILNAVPVLEGEVMVSAGGEELVVGGVGAAPDLLDDIVCELALEEGEYLVGGDEVEGVPVLEVFLEEEVAHLEFGLDHVHILPGDFLDLGPKRVGAHPQLVELAADLLQQLDQ